MIVEMAGRPAKHLTESLEKHVGILRNVKDIVVHSIRVSEPREIKFDKKTKRMGKKKCLRLLRSVILKHLVLLD